MLVSALTGDCRVPVCNNKASIENGGACMGVWSDVDQMAIVAWLEVLQGRNVPGWAALPDPDRDVLIYKFCLGGSDEPRTDDAVALHFKLRKRQYASRRIRELLLMLLISDRANHEVWPDALVKLFAAGLPKNPVRPRRIGLSMSRWSGRPRPVWVSAVFHFRFVLIQSVG
jgi:hypothetical protein